MPADLNGLRSLLKLNSPGNYTDALANGGAERESAQRTGLQGTGGNNPYDQQRMAEDKAQADADEAEQLSESNNIHQAQVGAKVRGFDTPADEAAYGRQLEQQKIQVPVEAARASGAASMDRLLAAQEAMNGRTAATQQGENLRQGERLSAAAARVPVPFQEAKAVNDAKTYYNSGTAKMGRSFGLNGGRNEYEQALNTYLDRKGSLAGLTKMAQQTAAEGKTAEMALDEARQQGVSLDPYEEDAFRMAVERQAGR